MSCQPTFWTKQFDAERPNRNGTDYSYIWTAEGWLFVAAVIDLFSRRVVGASITAQLVADALLMAIWLRGKPDALLPAPIRAADAPVISSSIRWPTAASSAA